MTQRYVAARKHSGGQVDVWHTDPDCRYLAGSTPRPLGTHEAEHKDLRPCSACADSPAEQTHDERECPVCGDATASLGYHLRVSCEGT